MIEFGLMEVNQIGDNKYDGEVSREYLAVVMNKLIEFVVANYK